MPAAAPLTLLRMGDRWDDGGEREIALLRGPRSKSADLAALAGTFSTLYDHGERLAQVRCVHHLRTADHVAWPCEHEQERARIRAWRAEQGWPQDDAPEAFVVWLCREHGFTRLEYRDVNLDALPFMGDGRRDAHVRVFYDPAYNGPGGEDYARTHSGEESWTLRAAFMPAAMIQSFAGPVEQQARAWLRSALHLSEGNFVSVQLDALCDKDGEPL